MSRPEEQDGTFEEVGNLHFAEAVVVAEVAVAAAVVVEVAFVAEVAVVVEVAVAVVVVVVVEVAFVAVVVVVAEVAVAAAVVVGGDGGGGGVEMDLRSILACLVMTGQGLSRLGYVARSGQHVLCLAWYSFHDECLDSQTGGREHPRCSYCSRVAQSTRLSGSRNSPFDGECFEFHS